MRRRRNFSDAEIKTYISKFRAGNLSKAEYCRKYNISESALYRWLRVTPRESSSDTNIPGFVPISTVPVPAKVKSDQVSHVSIKLGRIELSIPAGFDVGYLSCLLQGLESCC